MQTLRRQGRAYALQLLYLAEIDATSDAEARERFWWKGRASKKARAFATELVETTLAHQERIDHTLAATLEHWKLMRLPVVVRNLLRLSVCEMLVIGTQPDPVVMNEAVELTRTYMDDDSARFVNSVLEKVRLYRDVSAAGVPAAAESV